MRTFTFDARIFATITIQAENEEQALTMIDNASVETANLGCFANGDPIIARITEIENAAGGGWRDVDLGEVA